MDQNEQTEAVFQSVRANPEVDPVSGNEVPAGALPEEVRDDVPAMLSEGEYVVPADVLRYYGVKFFEDLRTGAKMGLTDMESNGRFGGEPVEEGLPFSMEEIAVVDDGIEESQGMAKGGYVKGYDEGGVVEDPTQMKTPDFLQGVSAVSPTTDDEYKLYTNAEGMTLYVRFVNGKPMTYVPPGYSESSSALPSTTQETSVDREEFDGGGYGEEGAPPGPDPSTMSAEELGDFADQTALAGTIANVAGMTGLAPGANIVGKIGTHFSNKAIDARAKELGIPSPAKSSKSVIGTITDAIFGSDTDASDSAPGPGLAPGGFFGDVDDDGTPNVADFDDGYGPNDVANADPDSDSDNDSNGDSDGDSDNDNASDHGGMAGVR